MGNFGSANFHSFLFSQTLRNVRSYWPIVIISFKIGLAVAKFSWTLWAVDFPGSKGLGPTPGFETRNTNEQI